jgi:hypothetical protein
MATLTSYTIDWLNHNALLFRTTFRKSLPVVGLVVVAACVSMYSSPDTGCLALPHFGGARKDCGLILGILFYH